MQPYSEKIRPLVERHIRKQARRKRRLRRLRALVLAELRRRGLLTEADEPVVVRAFGG